MVSLVIYLYFLKLAENLIIFVEIDNKLLYKTNKEMINFTIINYNFFRYFYLTFVYKDN